MCLDCCELICGRNLLARLKQMNEKLKGDIWLLDYLIRPNITSSQKGDLYVKRASK